MDNVKEVTFLKLNEAIAEEVTLLIGDEVVECFASYCPYELEVGRVYSAEISLNLSQSYEVLEVEPTDVRAVKKGRGFSYYLYGYLNGEEFMTFTTLFDEDVHYEYPDLNNKFICLEVERIDASFC